MSEARSSRLLIQEPPLQLLPSLAVKIGLNEALVLQQLHYLLGARETRDVLGVAYVAVSLPQWREMLPWWSEATIRRTLDRLQAAKLLLACQPEGLNRSAWYSIDYGVLDEVERATDTAVRPTGLLKSADASDQNEQAGLCKLSTCSFREKEDIPPTEAVGCSQPPGEGMGKQEAGPHGGAPLQETPLPPIEPPPGKKTPYYPLHLRVAEALIVEVEKLIAQGRATSSARRAVDIAHGVAKYAQHLERTAPTRAACCDLERELISAVRELAVRPFWAKQFLNMATWTTVAQWTRLHNEWVLVNSVMQPATPAPARASDLALYEDEFPSDAGDGNG